MVKIFIDYDAIQNIIDEIILNKIVGIYGGRVAVRKLMEEVVKKIESLDKDYIGELNISSPLSYDHPCTELGYLFDYNTFESDKAKKLVIDSYNKQYHKGENL